MTLEKPELGNFRTLRRGPTPHFLTYAGFVTRLMAMVIDLLILAVSWIIGGIATNFITETSGIRQISAFLSEFFTWITPLQETLLSATFEVIVFLTLGFFYFTFFYTFGGASVGKYLMGLRVLRSDGSPLTGVQAALRTLAYAVSSLPLYMGFVSVLLDDQRRAWHDRLIGTAVVHNWQARPDEVFLRRAIERIDQRPD